MEDVVISGLSCRLPEARNATEFQRNVNNGVDCVNDFRFNKNAYKHYNFSCGTVPDVDKFDADFFGIHPKLANLMDPQLRILLELTQEAIVDAGVMPETLQGSDTGVFVAFGLLENNYGLNTEFTKTRTYTPIGNVGSMFANRISFAYDFKGPSYSIRNGYSSGIIALDRAITAIKSGQCTQAIVAGCNLCLMPSAFEQYHSKHILSSSGKCLCYDSKADGIARSDGFVCFLLQKKNQAKRIYAEIIKAVFESYSDNSCGLHPPSSGSLGEMLRQLYATANVNPAAVSYVETSGCSIASAESEEVRILADVFCRNRTEPLLIGSIASNIGHTESASNLVSLLKIIVSMESTVVLPNLHFNHETSSIPWHLVNKLEIVNRKIRLTPQKCIMGINSYGLGNVAGHLIVQGQTVSHKEKTNLEKLSDSSKKEKEEHDSSLRLFVYCGRSKDSVQEVFNLVLDNPSNIDLHGLLQETAHQSPSLQPYRGYALLEGNKSHSSKIQHCKRDGKDPIWFVFSGMGTQWNHMGRTMMQFDIFRRAILLCDKVLRSEGVKLYELIMQGGDHAYDNVLHSFIALTSIQIGLVDMLVAMDIRPDGILGHSVGELASAYADGCLTAEETILSAYWRGRFIEEAKLPPGGMAAVGLTWKQAKDMCPPGIVPACHNAERTVTVSGPAADIASFIKQMKDKDIFVREVNSAGVAFHSSAMKAVAEQLLSKLQKIIKPKTRSSKWISTSVPKEKWETDLAKTSSAEYIVNNLVSPVLFQEALHHIPPKACVIEVAPHCLLQSVLKRSLDKSCHIVGLMNKDHANNREFFLSSIGQCYLNGMKLNPLNMTSIVTFPVPCGTPLISPSILWNHAQKWPLLDPGCFPCDQIGNMMEFNVSPENDYRMLHDHQINGLALFPAAGYIVMVWQTLANKLGLYYRNMPVVLESLVFHKATILPKEGTLRFQVNIMHRTGSFEISEGEVMVASGYIFCKSPDDLKATEDLVQQSPCKKSDIKLVSSDIYKELRLRGYQYGPSFRSLIEASARGEHGEIEWNDQWITYIDGLMQMALISLPEIEFALPTGIAKISIDPLDHLSHIYKTVEGTRATQLIVNRNSNVIRAGGVTLRGMRVSSVHRKADDPNIVLQSSVFVPYSEMGDSPNMASDIIKQYTHECCKAVQTGFNHIHESKTAFGKEYLRERVIKELSPELKTFKEVKENSLLHVLRKISSIPVEGGNFMHNIQMLLEAYREDLGQDQLLCNLLSMDNLQAIVDIIAENITSKEIRVLEVCERNMLFNKKLRLLMSNSPQGQFTFFVSEDTEMDHSALEDFQVQKLDWTINKADAKKELANVIILQDYLHRQESLLDALHNLHSTLKPDGFLILKEVTCNHHIQLLLEGFTEGEVKVKDPENRTLGQYCDHKQLKHLFEKANFNVVMEKSDDLLSSLFLLQKKELCYTEKQTIFYLNSQGCEWVSDLQEKFKEVKTKPKGENLWIISDKEKTSGILGLVRCLQKEPGGDRIRCVFVVDSESEFDLKADFKSLVQKDLAINVLNSGKWGFFAHKLLNHDAKPLGGKKTNSQLVDVKNSHIVMENFGDLDSFYWSKAPGSDLCSTMESNTEVCDVFYAGVNSRDFLIVNGDLGRSSKGGQICSEFSGKTSTGQRVMGILQDQALAGKVQVEKDLLCPIPDEWSYAEAATVLWPFGLATYMLKVLSKPQPGQSVLIYEACSQVGLASIRLAKHLGAKVFAVVKTSEELHVLREFFPKLPSSHVLNDKNSAELKASILSATKGKGVDLVMEGHMESQLETNISLLKNGGQLMTVYPYSVSTELSNVLMQTNIMLHYMDLDKIEGEFMKCLHKEMLPLVEAGAIKPLPYQVYSPNNIKKAFLDIAAGKLSTKKVLIKMSSDTPLMMTDLPVFNITTFPSHKSIIITGGLGGFGIELAQFLVDRGARNIILVSRTGVKSSYQRRKMMLWKDLGANVVISNDDITTMEGTKMLVERAAKMGPVGAVFHLAMVLCDALFENQTKEKFEDVFKPKVTGTINLDTVTRDICKESLDWFVVFSSVSSGYGNQGQTNYGFANSVMERICEMRKNDGLSGLAIQYGAIGDVGILAEKFGTDIDTVGGTKPQGFVSCLGVLDKFMCRAEQPVVCSYIPSEKISSENTQGQMKKSLTMAVLRIMGIHNDIGINVDKPLSDMGMDSLMLSETKHMMEEEFNISMTSEKIRSLTINELRKLSKSSSESTWMSTMSFTYASLSESKMGVRTGIQMNVPSQMIVHLNAEKTAKQPLFVLHSFDGCVSHFEELASMLSVPVIGFQFTADIPVDCCDIASVAGYYIQLMDSITAGPYNIVAYGYGVYVAMEIAHQLQTFFEDIPDIIGCLLLIDGSPDICPGLSSAVMSTLKSGSRKIKDQMAMSAFIKHVLHTNVNQETLVGECSEEIIQSACHYISEQTKTPPTESLHASANLYHNLALMVLDENEDALNNNDSRIKGDITLIRPKASPIPFCTNQLDYGLHKYCDGQVVVETFASPHEIFHDNSSVTQLAKIINKIISK